VQADPRVTGHIQDQVEHGRDGQADRGPGRLLGRVAMPGVRDAVAANLQKLKGLLEQ
jgi:hypothetical protein